MAGLSFLFPFALLGLLSLPILWFLLRISPPSPKHFWLPTISLVKDILPQENKPASTPWWLMLLRMLLLTSVILASSAPYIAPKNIDSSLNNSSPLVIILDDGWPSAIHWQKRIETIKSLLETNMDRPISLLPTSLVQASPYFESTSEAISRLSSINPKPYFALKEKALSKALQIKEDSKTPISFLWISDSMRLDEEEPQIRNFIEQVGVNLTIFSTKAEEQIAIVGMEQRGDKLEAIIRRAEKSGDDQHNNILKALDSKNRLLLENTFSFSFDQKEARLALDLPTELKNEIRRLEIVGHHSAGSVFLSDTSFQRRLVAIFSEENKDNIPSLSSNYHFIKEAISPFAQIRDAYGKKNDPLSALLENHPEILIMAENGNINEDNTKKLLKFVEDGGILIRFAGRSLAENSQKDQLLPVRLRGGSARNLGGLLSWEKPKSLGNFPENSPFYKLTIPQDVRIEKQVLAEPDADLSQKTWGILEDGTPIVTAKDLGNGKIILFHVTANAQWSNLPLSGLFVEMLQKIIILAKSTTYKEEKDTNQKGTLPPFLILDGFGNQTTNKLNAEPLNIDYKGAATERNPAGLYGSNEYNIAINAANISHYFHVINFKNVTNFSIEGEKIISLRHYFIIIAIIILIIDSILFFIISSNKIKWRSLYRAFAIFPLLLLSLSFIISIDNQPIKAQEKQNNKVSQEDIRSSLMPRIAYVKTNDQKIDEISKAGLSTLSGIIEERTSLKLDNPIGIDPSKDELAFYALLYWPISEKQSTISENTIFALNNFMKKGGTILFDTRDAFAADKNQTKILGMSKESQMLKKILGRLNIPPLETLPDDHVLTKTFYIINQLVGRYSNGETWVEESSTDDDISPSNINGKEKKSTKSPVRIGDRVSPIIITSNDLAAAWAKDYAGNFMLPVEESVPRQREMAYRSGINIVMYSMTGNYKTDQVHIPALLERLGK